VFVNLYIGGEGRIDLGGRTLTITQRTRYPWEGAVRLTVSSERAGEFELALRIPGWAVGEAMPTDLYRFLDSNDEKPALRINGEPSSLDIKDGYARMRRSWKKGDTVDLELPMPVRRVVAHDAVAEDRGRVALQRGPVVYAAEGTDHDGRVFNIVLPDGADVKPEFRPDLLNGVVVLRGQAIDVEKGAAGKPAEAGRPLLAVPYYAWANRGAGQMLVWLPRTAAAVKPPKKVDMSVD
jgi:hypothetical protein